MAKRYIVNLSETERAVLQALVNKGKTAAYRIKHANILLKVDAQRANWTDKQTAEAFACHTNTVSNLRQRFVEQGFETALERKKRDRPPRSKILDGAKEAHLLALGCSKPPCGHNRWTMQLLADKLIELEIVETVSRKTVARTLKKTRSSLT